MKRLIVFFLWMIGVVFPTITMAQSIRLLTKWTAQAQFAGYYAADKLGYYQEEGLDVCIQHPALSENPSSYLKDGRAEVVVMNLSYAISERMTGAPLVNIMQTSQESSLMLVSHSELKGLSSLKNRKIAVWNHLSPDLLAQLANYYGLGKVEWLYFNGGVNAFIAGAFETCLVSSYNEYIQLAEFGFKIDSTQVIKLADYGYKLPEDGLYVSEIYYNENQEKIRKLVKASMRGWAWVNEHPEEALDIVMDEIKRNNIGTNRYHQRRMLEELLHLQIDCDTNQRTYRLSKEGFKRATRVLIPKNTTAMPYEDFVK